MFGSLAAKAGSFETKLTLYIIVGVIAIVIVNLLLEGVKKFIRGLDTAALGALLIFLGYKASEFELVRVLSNLLYLIGGTLFASGILIFVIMTMIKHKRAVKRSGPPMPKEKKAKENTAEGTKPEAAESEAEETKGAEEEK